MGSSYCGEPGLGGGRSGSGRKGKKSNSEKPKQPQRGLGVAQLEQIRLRSQMSPSYMPSLHGSSSQPGFSQEADATVEMAFSSYNSASSLGLHPSMMMGLRGDMESSDIRYGDPLSTGTARWKHNSCILQQEQQPFQSGVTHHFLSLHAEDSAQKKRRQDRCDSLGSSSHYSDSSEGQELDLELKLSL